MIIQGTMGTEPILQDVCPSTTRLVIAAQRRERHPKISGWQAVELVAEPAGGAAVISDGNDRGQVIRNPSQGGQRYGESMPTAEGDDSRKAGT
jgi:hypothetical protein